MSDWQWYVALDGVDLDGLIGRAGLLRLDWPSKKIDYRFYDGVSGGHNPSFAPGGKVVLLGNFSQQIAVIDADSLDLLARQTTLGVEESSYRLRANTHHLWYDDKRFLCAAGDHLYRFDLDKLPQPEKLGAHGLRAPHELRWTGDRRYILMGDMGGEKEVSRQVAIYDTERNQSRLIRLPGTVWHTVVDPRRPIGYAATYTTAVEEGELLAWAPAYAREYLFEIDLAAGVVTRTWSAGADFPIHLNSDLELVPGDKPRLYVSCGGSHTVVEVDLDDFASTRVVRVIPGFWMRLLSVRQWWRNLRGAAMRRNLLASTHLILQTYLVTGGRTFDGVYCVRVSPDGKHLVAGNRGYNYVRVMDRETLRTVWETQLPRLPGALHLGLHHSEMRPRGRGQS